MLIAPLAIGTGAIGVACLFACWRKSAFRYQLLLCAGWLLLIASLWLWSISAMGVEYGMVYGLVLPALYAWAIIGYYSTTTRTNRQRQQHYQNHLPLLSNIMKNTGIFFIIFPGFMCASALISLACVYSVPAQDINRLAICVFLMPIMWGCMVFWFFTATHFFRPVIITVFITLLCGIYLFAT